jgi:predicted PurR-regulated permease PerM
MQFDGVMPFIIIGVCVTALHLVTGSYVIPRFIGDRVRINSVAAIVGLLFWWWLWGVIGFLLAMPLTALVRILLESNPRTAAMGELLASAPARQKT